MLTFIHIKFFDQSSKCSALGCKLVVETAILKLCVQLSEGSENICCEEYGSWSELVESLSSVHFDDLKLFLDETRAYHVKALLCRWNCDVEEALEIWKSLALGVLMDKHFPGSDYYIDALFSALILPTAFREHSISTTFKAVSTVPHGTLVGYTVYAEIVARHLYGFLASAESLPLADALIRHLACITSWNDIGSSTHPTTAILSTNDEFILSTDAIIKCLLPHYPDLAENYLWLRIFKAGDKEPFHHTLLAELQLQLLLRFAESKNEEKLIRQRLRFRYTLSRLEDCQTEKLLASLKSSSSAHLFTEEYVTLLGKLNKYDEALEVLVLKQKDVGAALRFCASCTNIEMQQKLIENSTLWSHQEIGDRASKFPHMETPKPNVYTVLLKLLLASNDPSLLEQSKKLLEMEIPSLDFAEILKVLPDNWQIDPAVSTFLIKAVKTTLTRESKSNIEFGLVSEITSRSRTEAAASISHGLLVSDASKCLQCHLPLNAYGDLRPFGWILSHEYSPSSVMHLHCLQSSGIL
nr:tgf beta receptor associated protein 1 [Hymenolepis microstoma]